MIDQNIRVSYVILTKNRARYLGKVLQNIKTFIERCDEIIIVDGGPSDETAELINHFGDVARKLISMPDFVEARALNRAAHLARGRYMKPITEDEYFHPLAMRTLIATAELNPDIDAILCGGEDWGALGSEPVFWRYNFLPKAVAPTPRAIYHYTCSGPGLMVRRSALEKTGGVPSNYVVADRDLVIRLIECNCKVRYLDINLYRRYLHEHSNDATRGADFQRDGRWFELRLGEWSNFVRQDPEQNLALVVSTKTEKLRALFYWIWIAGLLAHSPIWRVSLLLKWPLRIAGKVVRLAQRRKWMLRSSADHSHRQRHEWSGVLR
jgi:glycosyltransferase involved in cell wall biosynthesis